MKTLLTLTVSGVLSASALAAQYANTNSGQITASLPITLTIGNQLITGPTWPMYQSQGWLQVGYTQPPSNGWGILGNYAITPTSNGYCSLLITGQYNLRIASDTALTNSPQWLTLSNEMEVASNLVWKYSPGHNTTGLTNFSITAQTVLDNWATNTSVGLTNVVDFLNATWRFTDIVNFFGNSTNAPWRLIK